MALKVARIVAAVMLFLALGRLPYPYYIGLRWIVCAVAVWLVIVAFQQRRGPWAWTFVVVAILFNPVVPVRLTHQTWAPIDIIAAVLFLASIPQLQPAGRIGGPPGEGPGGDG